MGVTDGSSEAVPARLPVSLPPESHARLTDWCRRAADELQVTALARGEVLEALLAELVADPDTAAAVRHRLGDRLAVPRARSGRDRSWRDGSPTGRPRGLGR